MTGLPTGTITFLFTDVEGSTKLWECNPEAMSKALSHHDELIRNAVEAHDGFVFKTVGDAFYAAFSTAAEAVDRKSTRLNSSHLVISYAVFCLKKKNQIT